MKDKKILITGGSSGLGASLARKLVAMGARVIILDRDEDRGQPFANEIRCEYQFCNIVDQQSCFDAHQAIKEKFDDLDILINNAGIWTDDKLEEKEPSRRFDVFETNVIGTINLLDYFLPDFRVRNTGIIANTISVGALPLVSPDKFAKTYAATKGAMKRYSEALREDLRGTKIKVIEFFPGGFESNMYEAAGWDKDVAHNQPWMMKTDDVADCLIFALTRPDDVYISSMVVEKIA